MALHVRLIRLTINVFKIANTKPKWKNHVEEPGVDDSIILYCISNRNSRCMYVNDFQGG